MFEIEGCKPAETLIGDSPVIHRINAQLQKAASTEVPVLITGESGTGKELAARLLHYLSARRAHNFLKISCPSISNHIFESDFFEPGATVFTDGGERKTDRCGHADRGTLFLDEIGDMDLALQSKLLHALQNFRVVRSEATNERSIDIRLICATNRDIELEVAKGMFRTDLFYRINVLRIQMPSLRERTTDVPILMNHFIREYSERFGGNPVPLSTPVMKLLESYHWPGNVRELENMAKRYVVLGGEEDIISVMRHPEDVRSVVPDVVDLITPLRVQTKRAVQHLERKIILGVLEAHKWNRRKTARSLDISYRTLLYKIKEVGVPTISSGKSPSRKPTLDDFRGRQRINDFI